jgi:hypothetical protein
VERLRKIAEIFFDFTDTYERRLLQPTSQFYMILVGKPEGNKPLDRPRSRLEDNIKADLKEVECGDMDWMELAQDRDRLWALVNAIMNPRVP